MENSVALLNAAKTLNKGIVDLQIDIADELVREWLRDPENLEYLKQRKAEYLHTKGWSVSHVDGTKGNLKAEYDIPHKAFFALPPEIRNHQKELKKWVETRHPYLMFRSM